MLSARQVATRSGSSATSASTGWTGSPPTRRSARRPAERTSSYEQKALDLLYETSGGYPYFVQAYGKATWDHAATLPGHRGRRARSPRRRRRRELAVGFFGSRFERATPAEREYMRAMADAPGTLGDAGRGRTTWTRPSDRRDRRSSGPQAGQPLPGPGRADQEGADLLRRARHGRVHRAALRPLPAYPAGLSGPRTVRGPDPDPTPRTARTRPGTTVPGRCTSPLRRASDRQPSTDGGSTSACHGSPSPDHGLVSPNLAAGAEAEPAVVGRVAEHEHQPFAELGGRVQGGPHHRRAVAASLPVGADRHRAERQRRPVPSGLTRTRVSRA